MEWIFLVQSGNYATKQNYLHFSIQRYQLVSERLVMKTNLCWSEELRVRLSQAISSSQVTKIKPESFSFPPVANWFFRISTVPQLECRGIDSSNTSIRHVTAIVPFICLEFRAFRSQTNQNPDLASFLKWSHNRSNDRRIQRWKDMAACFKSGAKDATGTKVANQILSSIPRGLGNTGGPEKNAVDDKRSQKIEIFQIQTNNDTLRLEFKSD